MILFINVFIPGASATPYVRGLLPSNDRIDVFKYSLASLAALKWSQVIIHCDLHESHKHRRQELNDWINTLFPGCKYFPNRLDRQNMWKEAVLDVCSVEDELVWFCCNDDHIYLDYDSELIYSIENRLKKMHEDHPFVSCYFSHYPEMMTVVNYDVPHNVLAFHEDCFEVEWINIDSIQLLSKDVLIHWWFSKDYGDKLLVRSDGKLPISLEYECVDCDLPIRTLIPLREQCRHFDGYCRYIAQDGGPHLTGSNPSSNINKCPALAIPPGFFEKDIKIAFCHSERKPGYVHVNPLLSNYSSVDPNGADYKWMLEDIPLFWRDRISDIDIGEKIDRETLLFFRNKAVKDLANAEIRFRGINPNPPTMDKVLLRS